MLAACILNVVYCIETSSQLKPNFGLFFSLRAIRGFSHSSRWFLFYFDERAADAKSRYFFWKLTEIAPWGRRPWLWLTEAALSHIPGPAASKPKQGPSQKSIHRLGKLRHIPGFIDLEVFGTSPAPAESMPNAAQAGSESKIDSSFRRTFRRRKSIHRLGSFWQRKPTPLQTFWWLIRLNKTIRKRKLPHSFWRNCILKLRTELRSMHSRQFRGQHSQSILRAVRQPESGVSIYSTFILEIGDRTSTRQNTRATGCSFPELNQLSRPTAARPCRPDRPGSRRGAFCRQIDAAKAATDLPWSAQRRVLAKSVW